MDNFIQSKKKKIFCLKIPAKATVYYTAVSAAAKAVGIITTPIFTRILSEAEYGKYSFYMSWLGLFTVISSSVIAPSVIYRGLEKFKEEKEEFLFSALRLGWLTTLVFSCFIFVFSKKFGLEKELAPIISMQLICDCVINLSQTIYRYNYNYKKLSAIYAFSVAATPIFSIFLIQKARLGYLGRVYALLGVSLIIAIPQLLKIIKASKKRREKRLFLYLSRRALPLIPNSVSLALGAEFDKLMLTAVLGAAALAKYSIAHTLGLGVGFAVSAVSSALYPWVIRKLSEKKEELVRPIASSVLYALSGLGILISVFTPELFAFLAPKDYGVAAIATLPLILSTVPSFCSSFITLGLIYEEKGGFTAVSAVISTLFGIFLNLILIPRFQYFGAASSLLFSSLTAMAINYFFLKKRTNTDILRFESFLKAFAVTLVGISLSVIVKDFLALRILLLILPISLWFYAFCDLEPLLRERL